MARAMVPAASSCAAGMWPARCAGLPKEGHVGFATLPEKELSASKVPSLGLDFEILAAGDGFFQSVRAAQPFLSPGSFGGSKCIKALSQQSDRERLQMP